MLSGHINKTLDIWIVELGKYNISQLNTKPSPEKWSLGQVYMHLLEDTSFYLEQVKICVCNNDYSTGVKSPVAELMFLRNDFPDEELAGAPANLYMPQPKGVQQLMHSFLDLKNQIHHVAMLVSQTSCEGKTQHPGLGYFSAHEWLHFTEMHLRHHLRQKKRIDNFLEITHS